MKLFQNSRKKFAILGIMNSNQQASFNKHLLITCLIFGWGFIACTVFFFYKANNFKEYSNTAYLATTMTMGFIISLNMASNAEALHQFILNIEDLVEKRSVNPASKALYEKTNRLVEKISVIGSFVFGILAPVGWIWPKAIICYFVYFTTDLGNEAFELPAFAWFPFNWKNPFGYLIAVIVEYIVASYALILSGVLSVFGIGILLYVLTGLGETKDGLRQINDSAKFEQNRSVTLNRIGDFIDLHGQFLQLFRDFQGIIQPVFMVLAVSSLVLICGVLLFIQIEINKLDALVVFVAVFYAAYASFVIFMICEPSQQLSNAFEQITADIENLEWYLYSHEIQRMLPIVLLVSQRPIELECFGSIRASRKTFKKVIKSALSYFLTIRKFL